MSENPYEAPKTKIPSNKKPRKQRGLWIVRSLFMMLCLAILFTPRTELESPSPSKTAQLIAALIFYFIVTSMLRLRKR